MIAWARKVAEAGNTKRLRWLTAPSRRRRAGSTTMSGTVSASPASLSASLPTVCVTAMPSSYEDETGGLPSPIKGGALGQIDRETHRVAIITVSRALGHGRIDVTTGYYGSYGHALRQAPVSMTYKFNPLSLSSADKQGQKERKTEMNSYLSPAIRASFARCCL